MHACMHACMYVCMYVRTYVRTYVFTHERIVAIALGLPTLPVPIFAGLLPAPPPLAQPCAVDPKYLPLE